MLFLLFDEEQVYWNSAIDESQNPSHDHCPLFRQMILLNRLVVYLDCFHLKNLESPLAIAGLSQQRLVSRVISWRTFWYQILLSGFTVAMYKVANILATFDG